MDFFAIYRKILPIEVRRFIKKMYFFIRTKFGLEYLYTTLEEYEKNYPANITYLNDVSYNLFYSNPQFIFDSKVDPCISGGNIKSKVCIIKNVCCFAASDVLLLHNNKCFYELRDNYIHDIDRINCADGVVVLKDAKHYRNIDIPSNIKNVKCGIFLTGIYDTNYYHLTFQHLSKFKEILSLDKSVPLLVNKKVYDVRNYKELISYFNYQNREIVLLEPNISYKVESLYYVPIQMLSVPSYRIGTSVRSSDDQYCYDSLNFIRKQILSYCSCTTPSPRRIFISRRKTTSRRSYNEIECYEVLKKYGFVEVFPENMSIKEQVSLFNNADYIVGATGAAFTNLIYCHENCNVIILMGYKADYSIFSSLSHVSKCKISYLYDEGHGKLTDASKEHSDFYINIDLLESYIEKMINN